MEVNGWSVQNNGFEICLFATLCEQQDQEVQVSQVQKKDLQSQEVQIQTELCTQNHVDDPEKILEEMRKDDGVSSYIDAKILKSLDEGVALGLKLQQGASGRLDFCGGNEIPKMKERLCQ